MLGGLSSRACGINNADQIAGNSGRADNEQTAFFYDSGTMYELATLVVNLGESELFGAWAIGDRGHIVGYGFVNGEERGFLLTPDSVTDAPEPAALGLLGLGVIGLAASRRRCP